MSEIAKFKKILKACDITGEQFANKLGIKYNSYRTMTAPKAKSVPKWVLATNEVWKLAHDEDLLCIECGVNDNGFGLDFLFCEECAIEFDEDSARKVVEKIENPINEWEAE